MTFLRVIISAAWLAISLAGSIQAHALEPGYLDVRQQTENTWRIFWRKPDVNGRPMAIDAQLPDICTPESGPKPTSDGQAWASTWIAHCSGDLAGTSIAISGLEAQNTDVLLRLQRLDKKQETFRLTPSTPAVEIPKQPSTFGVIVSYAQLGFEHILEGWDHLLFVFALLFLVRNPWRLFGAITSFTVAHSITLALAALGAVRVPGPPVEAIIALSIIFLASEILHSKRGELRLSERYPWVVCFLFGLLHGLGFAGALTEIGLPQQDIIAALLAFNVGVEAGQIAFVVTIITAFSALRQIPLPDLGERVRSGTIGVAIMGYAIGGMATYWLVERVMAF